MIALPKVSEEISIEWLNHVLTESGFLKSVSITDFAVESLGAELGYLGQLYRLKLNYSKLSDLPVTLIIKFPSTEAGARSTGNSLRAYERESLFYQHCPDKAPCRPPDHYYSYSNPQEDEYILIIEDLLNARFVNQMDGVNPDDAMKCIRALAELHARYWNADQRSELGWAPHFSEYGELYRPLLQSGTPLIIKNWQHLLPPILHEHMNRANEAFPLIAQHLGSLPLTLAHCDPRIENIAFIADEPRFYDWQLVSKGPAAYDVMYFLMQSMDIDLRRGCQDELFKGYVSTLSENGISDYTTSQLIDDIGWASSTIWAFLGVVGNIFFPNDVNTRLAKITLPRWAGMIDDFGGVEKLDRIIGKSHH